VWYNPEARFPHGSWCWSPGTAAITIHSPLSAAGDVDILLKISSGKTNILAPLSIEWNGREVWNGTISRQTAEVALKSLRVEPGDNKLLFKTADVPVAEGRGDQRHLAFCLHGMDVDLRGEPAH
jgi:hypothetical protein